MIFRVGIENNNEGRSVAWALEHPGCFAYGPNANAAEENLSRTIQVYATWILKHEPFTWLNFEEVETQVEENWDVYLINDEFDKVEKDGYSVDSFFRHDWKPLTAVEIQRALKMLTWSRADLLKTVEGLSDEELNQTYLGERWSINGILGHIGGAEWWYLDRLGLAFPRQEVPEESFTRLEKVRALLKATLPTLEGSKQVVGVDGEIWSSRKALRRALWHERDHIEHIRKLLKELAGMKIPPFKP
ncbi:MAG: DinB family protein [Anaerolineales bacterium]|nr:DinB family protein [Anaerolineales bacterium]